MSTNSSAGKLGRDSVPFAETMARYHGEIERLVYAAEIACPIPSEDDNMCIHPDSGCVFIFNSMAGLSCSRYFLRAWIGDHIQQHDAMPGVPAAEQEERR